MSKKYINRRKFLKYMVSGFTSSLLITTYGHSFNTENPKLRISTPLSLSAFPIEIGNQLGIFKKHGLDLSRDFVPSPYDRLTLLSTNQLQCVISDLSSLIIRIINSPAGIIITSTAGEGNNNFRSLALMGSGRNYYNIKTIDELIQQISYKEDNSITIPLRTDFEYATDQLFNKLGYKANKNKLYTHSQDFTYSLLFLITGRYLASVLPEPLATLAGEKNSIPNGGELRGGDWAYDLSNYQDIDLLPPVVAFNKQMLNQPGAIEKFYDAYRETIRFINSSPEGELRKLATETGISIFQAIYSTQWKPQNRNKFEQMFNVPQFAKPEALEESKFNSVVEWINHKGYRKSGKEITLSDVFDGRFLS